MLCFQPSSFLLHPTVPGKISPIYKLMTVQTSLLSSELIKPIAHWPSPPSYLTHHVLNESLHSFPLHSNMFLIQVMFNVSILMISIPLHPVAQAKMLRIVSDTSLLLPSYSVTVFGQIHFLNTSKDHHDCLLQHLCSPLINTNAHTVFCIQIWHTQATAGVVFEFGAVFFSKEGELLEPSRSNSKVCVLNQWPWRGE